MHLQFHLQQSAHVDSVHTDNIQALTSLQQHSPLTASNLKRSRLESNASQSSDCPSISILQLAQQFRGLDVRVSQHDGIHWDPLGVNINTDTHDMNATHIEPGLCRQEVSVHK